MPTNKLGHFYYARYPAIWRADTQHLSLAEDGAYHRLVDYYMETRKPLPGADQALSRIIGVGINEWLSIKETVLAFFKPTGLQVGSGWVHSFCERELKEDDERRERARKNGKKGGRKKKKTKQNQPIIENKPSGLPDGGGSGQTQNRTEQRKEKKIIKPVLNGERGRQEKNIPQEKNPDEISDNYLPLGWLNMAEEKGFSNERIYKSWGKFIQMSPYPFQRTNWAKWVGREHH